MYDIRVWGIRQKHGSSAILYKRRYPAIYSKRERKVGGRLRGCEKGYCYTVAPSQVHTQTNETHNAKFRHDGEWQHWKAPQTYDCQPLRKLEMPHQSIPSNLRDSFSWSHRLSQKYTCRSSNLRQWVKDNVSTKKAIVITFADRPLAQISATVQIYSKTAKDLWEELDKYIKYPAHKW